MNTADDKGRGSYKCGRCGVPKKGHVCPYQPKVKRRPDDPVPEMKCVSTQVEMDEVSCPSFRQNFLLTLLTLSSHYTHVHIVLDLKKT